MKNINYLGLIVAVAFFALTGARASAETYAHCIARFKSIEQAELKKCDQKFVSDLKEAAHNDLPADPEGFVKDCINADFRHDACQGAAYGNYFRRIKTCKQE